MKVKSLAADFVRGALIGTAEVIPGVSGGTIALVVGLYDRLISSAANAIKAIAALVSLKPTHARASLRQVEFTMLVPLAIGMVAALVAGSATIEPLLETEPELMRGLFAGMIMASLVVPIRLVSQWRIASGVMVFFGFVAAFALTSLERLPAAQPQLIWVFAAAALAVCALVLPGVSGSFLLLAMGMYQPTIAAVNDRDLGYLGVFALGAIAGMATFALLLQWLLTKYHDGTMALMTGLMLGSLRALWPWQTESGALETPADPVLPMVGVLVGASVVLGLIFLEQRIRQSAQ
jgi:putative membrane protein